MKQAEGVGEINVNAETSPSDIRTGAGDGTGNAGFFGRREGGTGRYFRFTEESEGGPSGVSPRTIAVAAASAVGAYLIFG
jgi:hypothetical protein